MVSEKEQYDYKATLGTRGTSAWRWSYGYLEVLNPAGRVLFTVSRGGRLTQRGTNNALAKEFVKILARWVGMGESGTANK